MPPARQKTPKMRDESARLFSGGQLNTTVKSDEGSFAIWAVVLIIAEDSLLFLPYFRFAVVSIWQPRCRFNRSSFFLRLQLTLPVFI